MKDYLTTDFLGFQFKNPVLTASGTFGFGEDYTRYYDPSCLGGFCTKGLTLESREGNYGQRLWETPSGLLNSIGLENPGVETFINEIYPRIKDLDTNIIVNVGGSDRDSYVKVLEKLNALDSILIELNISCPNVKAGGMSFGTSPDLASSLVKDCVTASQHPLIVKLTPNVTDIAMIAQACEEAGAAALSLINTVLAMAIDVDKREIVFKNTYAGLSGPAIKPIALRMVHQVAKSVDIPIIGIGGISSYKDALEFIMAGASLIEVGTFSFAYPRTPIKIIEGLDRYTKEKNVRIEDLVGIL